MKTFSHELNELAAALSAAQGEFGAVPKDSDNPFFKSKYASLATAMKTAGPIVAKHGLAVTQFLGSDESGELLTTWLLHRSGQYICDQMRLHAGAVKGLTDAQAQGSATTYARRYSYMSVLGLVADEDDDGARAPGRSESASPSAHPSPASAPPTASAPKASERPASAKQRGLLNAKAAEADLSPMAFANLVLSAAGDKPRLWEDREAAQQWLKRSMDRLPARLVNPILEGIEKAKAVGEFVEATGAEDVAA